MAIHAPAPHERDWILGTLHKHVPDALAVLGELLKAGIRDGQCSVNDVTVIPTDKGVTGAVMKLLKELGFEHTEEKIQDMRLGKKGKVSVWKMVDRSKVDTYLEANLQYWHTLLHEPLPEHIPSTKPIYASRKPVETRSAPEPY